MVFPNIPLERKILADVCHACQEFFYGKKNSLPPRPIDSIANACFDKAPKPTSQFLP